MNFGTIIARVKLTGQRISTQRFSVFVSQQSALSPVRLQTAPTGFRGLRCDFDAEVFSFRQSAIRKMGNQIALVNLNRL